MKYLLINKYSKYILLTNKPYEIHYYVIKLTNKQKKFWIKLLSKVKL